MYGRRWQLRQGLDMNQVLPPRALHRSPAAVSGGHNSPVATSCQYHDYIVPMPYFYCLIANLDRSVNTCNCMLYKLLARPCFRHLHGFIIALPYVYVAT